MVTSLLWKQCSGLTKSAGKGKRKKSEKIHGSVGGQAGYSFKQPGLVQGVPGHGRGVGTG